MRYLPLFLDVRGRRCVVIGGTEPAARKTELLLRAHANVVVIARQLGASMQALAGSGAVEHRPKHFERGDLDGAVLVVTAAGEDALDAAVHAAALEAGIPVNAVDKPALCAFVTGSIVDRSPVLIAISSSGAAPVLVRTVRQQLETLVPQSLGRLAALAETFRDAVKARIPPGPGRRIFWECVLAGKAATLVSEGREDAAREAIAAALNAPGADRTPEGEVYLIGAGPGDPELLTLRALRLLQQADVVLHDRLVSDAVLDLCRRDSERIYVGKREGQHTMPAEAVNDRLVTLAASGLRVARLKGGDPLTFGRATAEIQAVARAGLTLRIVPGITAAAGCAAVAGFSLTHPELAPSCTFATVRDATGALDLDWAALAKPRQTVVLFMGRRSVAEISRGLMAHGRDGTTPVALVSRGTLPDQHLTVTTLQRASEAVDPRALRSPALLIVGEVVATRMLDGGRTKSSY